MSPKVWVLYSAECLTKFFMQKFSFERYFPDAIDLP